MHPKLWQSSNTDTSSLPAMLQMQPPKIWARRQIEKNDVILDAAIIDSIMQLDVTSSIVILKAFNKQCNGQRVYV